MLGVLQSVGSQSQTQKHQILPFLAPSVLTFFVIPLPVSAYKQVLCPSTYTPIQAYSKACKSSHISCT